MQRAAPIAMLASPGSLMREGSGLPRRRLALPEERLHEFQSHDHRLREVVVAAPGPAVRQTAIGGGTCRVGTTTITQQSAESRPRRTRWESSAEPPCGLPGGARPASFGGSLTPHDLLGRARGHELPVLERADDAIGLHRGAVPEAIAGEAPYRRKSRKCYKHRFRAMMEKSASGSIEEPHGVSRG